MTDRVLCTRFPLAQVNQNKQNVIGSDEEKITTSAHHPNQI